MEYIKSKYKGQQNVPTSFVYLLMCVNPLSDLPVYKIGYSVRPEERVYSDRFGKLGVGIQYPFPVYILAAYETCGDRGVESRLHDLYREYQSHAMYGDGSTEWFEIPMYDAETFLNDCKENEPYKMREDAGREIVIVDYEEWFAVGDSDLWNKWYYHYSKAAKYFNRRRAFAMAKEWKEKRVN